MENQQAPIVASQPSSSLTSPPSSANTKQQNGTTTRRQEYRPARELPFELAQHVQNYCEEALFTRAFEHLISAITNSISSTGSAIPVSIPPSNQLDLASTISVHPMFTSRATSNEKHNQANSALRLLRLLLKVVGPLTIQCTGCFKFRKFDHRLSDGEENESSDDLNRLRTRYASSNSVYCRVEDFWSVIGWAFNCACLSDMHAVRWEHWKPWLMYMVDFLETDWELHNEFQTCEESLLWQYIELASGGYGRARRMFRAIFADGSSISLNEFREVFNNELMSPAAEKTDVKKRKVDVNVEDGIFGDYLEDDDSDLSDFEASRSRSSKRQRTRTPSARRRSSQSSSGTITSNYEDDAIATTTETITTLGSSDCMRLRIRLLNLLVHVSYHPTLLSTSPTTFPDLSELYHLLVEHIRPLPLSIFTDFVSPSTYTDVLSPDAHITLCETILQRMLESDAPASQGGLLTERKLREDYIPWAASKNTAEAQVKVSLVMEALVRRCASVELWKQLNHDQKEALLRAVQAGADKRDAIATQAVELKKGKRGGKKRGGNEEEALQQLKASAARMKLVVQLLK